MIPDCLTSIMGDSVIWIGLAVLASAVAFVGPQWVRWLRKPQVPEFVGATENWSPLRAFAAEPADWDEDAQVHVALDAMEAELHECLDLVLARAVGALLGDASAELMLAGVA